MKTRDHRYLWQMGYMSIRDLEVESGILASGKDELYGCIFGRDSLITALLLLRAYKKINDPYFLDLTRKILLNLALLQGKEINIESGEEPGKIIHEFRPDRHEHLTAHPERPWYLYPDQTMKSYDSVDSTPLFLLATHTYMEASGTEFLPVIEKLLPYVKAGLEWILVFGDSNGDALIDYRFHEKRRFGGLVVQSWMDSHDSTFHETDESSTYPIAPIEVQSYAWAALRKWADYYRATEPDFSERLESRARELREHFHDAFVLEDDAGFSLAFAVDGAGKKLKSARSSMGHILWASYMKEDVQEAILQSEMVPRLVLRLMQSDMFVPYGGIRTLSTNSKKFQPQSYHNGSIWPHDTEIIAVGFENFGYVKEAQQIRDALFAAYLNFKTPLEFFCLHNDSYADTLEPSGQRACQVQAWSAGALISALTSDESYADVTKFLKETAARSVQQKSSAL